MLALAGRYRGPVGLRAAGRGRLVQSARRANPRGSAELVEQLWTALAGETVAVPGTDAAETVLPKLAPRTPQFSSTTSPSSWSRQTPSACLTSYTLRRLAPARATVAAFTGWIIARAVATSSGAAVAGVPLSKGGSGSYSIIS